MRTVLLMIFFGGLDVLAYFARGFVSQEDLVSLIMGLLSGQSIELVLNNFNSSSNITLLFWLYNQIIPFSVGFMLILLKKQSRSIIVIFALLVLYSPFPCIALCPVLIYMVFRNRNIHITKIKDISSAVKEMCGVEDLCVIPYLGIVGLYYISNIATGKTSLLVLTPPVVAKFVFYFAIEFGVYLAILRKDIRNDPILRILLIVTVACSFVVMGNSNDFA